MVEKGYMSAISAFMKKIEQKHSAGNATELSYRSDLELLLTVLGKEIVHALNESKGIKKIGKPDITMLQGDIPIGYLEAKDIGVSIRKFTGANKIQFDRYTENLDNLIYTNCLDWDFYRNGKKVGSLSVGKLDSTGKIIPTIRNFGKLGDYLLVFLAQRPQSIKTPEELTEHMSRRTRMIFHTLKESLTGKNSIDSLQGEYNTVVDELIKGLNKNSFADMYAQTITYGLLAARLNSTPETFTRQALQNLLPRSYPFLSKLLLFIATEDLGDSLDFSINDLISLYRAVNVSEIMKPYVDDGEDEDPFLHFYEEFLKQYNAKERKKKGAYYTPKPVVEFIVREVDWVLKNKFNMPEGLANSEKIDAKWKTDRAGNLDDKEVHKVQILDPATGTGTFLAQTIRQIEKHVKKFAPGNWDSYVDKNLLPRLNGFEIMIAPYAISYLKLDRELERTGYKPTSAKPERMHIYLTNSLAKPKKKIENSSYNQWFVNEAQGAKKIKEAQPIMCVIGNPPYAGESDNKDPWITKLLDKYKESPELKKPAQTKWLSDDYVKFIRLAQYMVEKNGEGVVGMVTSHSYLDNPTFCDMRRHLMESFDGIYILDLHGNARRHEVCPNGDPDKNVFDIMTGVSIIIAWKTKQAKGTEKPLAQIFRGDLWGTREEKFDALRKESLDSELFQQIEPRSPKYLFKPVDYDLLEEYEKGFKITEFMPNNAPGIVTTQDQFAISWSAQEAKQKVENFLATESETEARNIWRLCSQSQWNYGKAKEELSKNEWQDKVMEITYRPFDTRTTVYNTHVAVHLRDKRVMRHFLARKNLGLLISRSATGQSTWQEVQCTDKIVEFGIMSTRPGNSTPVFPLYLYDDDKSDSKRINMDKTIRKAIEDVATDSKNGKPNEYAIFDYIYGILHASEYRERYVEFLKADFPYIPYPKDSADFWHLSSVGTKLRELHLIPDNLDGSAYKFEGVGEAKVERPRFASNKVFLNDLQYFDKVPKSAWEFFIGGYQPAQLWLKKRKGRTLEHKDILHYQKIIAVLVQTKTTMDDIKWSRP